MNAIQAPKKLNSQNSWQNQGIMRKWAKENIQKNYRETFLDIVDESFGYGNRKTLHKTINQWADTFEISRSTFKRHVQWLSEHKFITINTWKAFIPGGGSKPNSYSPCFPSGYAKIQLNDKNSKEEKRKQKVENENNKLEGMM